MSTADEHLAAILAAWDKTDGYDITPEMNAALVMAETDTMIEAQATKIRLRLNEEVAWYEANPGRRPPYRGA